MTTTTSTIQSASLHYREGSSDKAYHAAIEPKADGLERHDRDSGTCRPRSASRMA